MTHTTDRRFNGKCKGCGKYHTTLAHIERDGVTWHGDRPCREWIRGDVGRLLVTCECGKSVGMKVVLGKFNAKKVCNEKCMSAHGHVCECSCGGQNHGCSI